MLLNVVVVMYQNQLQLQKEWLFHHNVHNVYQLYYYLYQSYVKYQLQLEDQLNRLKNNFKKNTNRNKHTDLFNKWFKFCITTQW